MTFYVDIYHSDIHSYVLNNHYSVRSSGVVYKVMERQRETQTPFGYETKVAAPGMLTVHIQQEKRRRLPYPYGNCIESEAIENSFENCVDRCARGNIFNRCNCENVIIQSERGKQHVDQSWTSNDTATQSTTRKHNFAYCFDLRQTRAELYERYLCYQSALYISHRGCYSACPHRCVTTQYRTEATSARWPLPFQYDSFYKKVIADRSFSSRFSPLFERNNSGDNDLIDKVNDLYKSKLIEENFVQVEFVPQYLVYLELIEVPRYTISSMVCTPGWRAELVDWGDSPSVY